MLGRRSSACPSLPGEMMNCVTVVDIIVIFFIFFTITIVKLVILSILFFTIIIVKLVILSIYYHLHTFVIAV